MTVTISASNETISEAAGVTLSLSGSSDVVNMANGDTVILLSGSTDTINMSASTLTASNSVTGGALNGSNDLANLGVGDQFAIAGNSDVVNAGTASTISIATGGVGDIINLSGSTLSTASYVTGGQLNGSTDTANLGIGNAFAIAGNTDVVNAGTASTISIATGDVSDTVNMSSSTLSTAANVTSVALNGSSDLANLGTGNKFAIAGSSDVVNAGTASTISIATGGTGDIINMSGSTLSTSTFVTSGQLNGSTDTANLGASNGFAIAGNTDVVNVGTASTISIATGDVSDTVNMSSSTLSTAANVTSGALNGSSDVANLGAGNKFAIAGSSDVINAGTASTISIATGGVGDILKMSGSTLSTSTFVTSGQLNGSTDTANLGAGNGFAIAGNTDVVNAGTASTISIATGDVGDTVNMSSSTLSTAANVTSGALNGSSDHANLGTGNKFAIAGNSDIVNAGTASTISIATGGAGDILNMSGSTLSTSTFVTSGQLNGSTDTANLGAGNGFAIAGNTDVVNAGTTSTISIATGDVSDTINMSNSTLSTAANVTTGALNGSSDMANLGAGNKFAIAGSSDVVNAGTASTISIATGGAGDILNMSGSTLSTSSFVTTGQLNGSTDTANLGAGNGFAIAGNSDVVNAGTASSISIATGDTSDTANMSNSTLSTAGYVTGAQLNGSTNLANLGTGNSLAVAGNSNVVNGGTASTISIATGGVDDIVNMSGSTLSAANYVTGAELNGSTDLANIGIGDSLAIAGNSDVVNSGTASVISVATGGVSDIINMSGSTLSTGSYVTAGELNGSNDLANLGTGDNIAVSGNSNVINSGNASTISIATGGVGDTVNMSGSTFSTGIYVTAGALNGSNDLANLGVGDSFTVAGNHDVINSGTASSITLAVGNVNDLVNVSSSTLTVDNYVTFGTLSGSNDTVYAGVGDIITFAGSSDVINVAEGSTVTLAAGDSGDTVNMIGGTLVAASGISGITVNGTGNAISGAGSTAVSSTPGNIADLVQYFAANPFLSQDQILAAESDSNYATNLANYLQATNISTLSSDVLANLEGYSVLDLVLFGYNPSIFTQAITIEKDFAWGAAASNYQVPDENDMSTVLQDLLPTLEDTNAQTKLDVSDALYALQLASDSPGNAGNIVIDDVAAKLFLEMAEQPDTAKTATETDPEIIKIPGFSGVYKITAQPGTPSNPTPWGANGSNESIYIKNESGGAWGEFLSILDNYIGPLIDLAAVLSLNPEFIALTGIPELATSSLQVASTAFSLAQAGQDFSQGEDVTGVLATLGAVGGALQDLDAGAGALQTVLGKVLSDGSEAAQTAYNLSVNAESGNILGVLISALGGTSEVAGLSNLPVLQQFANLGEGLAATALAAERQDIIGALTSFVQASTAYQNLGGVSGIAQDVNALWAGFAQQASGVGSAAADQYPSYSTTPVAASPYPVGDIPDGPFPTSNGLWQYYTLLTNVNGTVVGIDLLDPTDTADSTNPQGNTPLIDGSEALAQNDGLNGNPVTFMVVGHGNAQGIAATPTGLNYSAESVESSMANAGYQLGENVEVIACNTALTNNAQVQYNGNAPGADFAQTLANLTGTSNLEAFNGYVIMNSEGSYIVNTSDLTNVALGNTPGLDTSSSLNNASMIQFAAQSGLQVHP